MNGNIKSKRKVNLVATLLIAVASASLTRLVLGAESNFNQCNESIELQSSKCNGNGNYACGVCECDASHLGERCECTESVSDCRQNYFMIECSGRGICVCGVCTCNVRSKLDEVIYGKYCECDNFSCVRHNGRLCAGNGVCECGECKCKAGWTDFDCSIPV